MDRSDEFLAIVANVGPTVGNSPLIGRLAPSPLILRAVEMVLSQIWILIVCLLVVDF